MLSTNALTRRSALFLFLLPPHSALAQHFPSTSPSLNAFSLGCSAYRRPFTFDASIQDGKARVAMVEYRSGSYETISSGVGVASVRPEQSGLAVDIAWTSWTKVPESFRTTLFPLTGGGWKAMSGHHSNGQRGTQMEFDCVVTQRRS